MLSRSSASFNCCIFCYLKAWRIIIRRICKADTISHYLTSLSNLLLHVFTLKSTLSMANRETIQSLHEHLLLSKPCIHTPSHIAHNIHPLRNTLTPALFPSRNKESPGIRIHDSRTSLELLTFPDIKYRRLQSAVRSSQIRHFLFEKNQEELTSMA